MKNKEVIFFDGDGTIWYPKKTKSKIAPHWIYSDKEIGDNYIEHLILIPSALAVLKKLKKLGKILVIVSTHPQPREDADISLKKKIEHFKLEKIFDGFYTAKDYPEGKGEVIAKILKERHIPKSRALMIGDSYKYDYLSAKKVGVDALLIKSPYMSAKVRSITRTINRLKDLLEL